jgi:hypothetical protein
MNHRPPATRALHSVAVLEQWPTYQDLLDESLQETFPASDPISPTGACRTGQRISTSRNDIDWQVVPGSAHKR